MVDARKCIMMLIAMFLLASVGAQNAQEYVLGPEDVVTVTVLRHPEFSGEYLIPQSGIVLMPAVGNIKLTGLTPAAVAQQVATKLKARLLKPEVSASVKQARQQRVYVFGSLNKPGVFDVKPGWRVSESLSAAGGLLPNTQTADVNVILEREGRPVVTAPLSDALGTRANDFLLQTGDVLRFESISLIPVYVSGKVKTPGILQLRSDSRSVLAAISQAGGVIEDASTSTVRIIRVTGNEEVVDLTSALVQPNVPTTAGVQNVSLTTTTVPKELPILNAGDMVVVPESQNRFVVLGSVSKPGYYSIPQGRVYTLADAVALAAGEANATNNRGRLSRVGLVRREGEKEVRNVYDLGKYLQKGDVSQNPTLRPGDVVYIPESNRVEVATILSGISSAALLFRAFQR
jgi:polysaccharide export outer membrane protein